MRGVGDGQHDARRTLRDCGRVGWRPTLLLFPARAQSRDWRLAGLIQAIQQRRPAQTLRGRSWGENGVHLQLKMLCHQSDGMCCDLEPPLFAWVGVVVGMQRSLWSKWDRCMAPAGGRCSETISRMLLQTEFGQRSQVRSTEPSTSREGPCAP